MSNPLLTTTHSKLDTRVKEPSGVVQPPSGVGLASDRFSSLFFLILINIFDKVFFFFFFKVFEKSIKTLYTNTTLYYVNEKKVVSSKKNTFNIITIAFLVLLSLISSLLLF